MDKRIICRNDSGIEVKFDYDFEDFFLESCEGIYEVNVNVTTSENTTTNGATYQGSTVKQRNIVITASMDKDFKKKRELLYKVFKPAATGKFTYSEDGEKREIDYKVESIQISEKGIPRTAVISLLCPDPFFKAMADIEVRMAGWVDNLEFPVEFPEEGIEFGYRVAELVKEIDNDVAADNIGIMAVITAEGAVTNPTLYHAENGEYMRVNYAMKAAQTIVITTGQNKKKVWLLENVTESERIEKGYEKIIEERGININEYFSEGSSFIQLQQGKNTITYAADEGIDYMNVSIFYRLLYLGV